MYRGRPSCGIASTADARSTAGPSRGNSPRSPARRHVRQTAGRSLAARRWRRQRSATSDTDRERRSAAPAGCSRRQRAMARRTRPLGLWFLEGSSRGSGNGQGGRRRSGCRVGQLAWQHGHQHGRGVHHGPAITATRACIRAPSQATTTSAARLPARPASTPAPVSKPPNPWRICAKTSASAERMALSSAVVSKATVASVQPRSKSLRCNCCPVRASQPAWARARAAHGRLPGAESKP